MPGYLESKKPGTGNRSTLHFAKSLGSRERSFAALYVSLKMYKTHTCHEYFFEYNPRTDRINDGTRMIKVNREESESRKEIERLGFTYTEDFPSSNSD